MNFNLRHLLLFAVLIGIFAALISTLMRVDIDQRYSSIDFSPDSTRIAVQGNFNTQIFDVDRKRKIADIDSYSDVTPEHIEFVDDNHLMTLGFSNNHRPRAVWWYQMPSNKLVRHFEFATLFEHFNSARNGFLYSNNSTQEVMFFSNDVKGLQPLAKVGNQSIFYKGLIYQNPNSHAYFNGTAADLASAGPYWPETTQIEYFEQGGQLSTLRDLPVNAKISPDGKNFTVETPNWFSYHDQATGRTLWSHRIQGSQRCRYSGNSRYVGVEEPIDRNLYVFEAATGRQLLKIKTDRDYMPIPFAISNDGKLAIAREEMSDAGIEIYDIATAKKLTTSGVTNSESRWIFVSLTYSIWLMVWSIVWAFVIPKSRPLTKLPRVVSVIYWLHVFAFGAISAFAFCGLVFRQMQLMTITKTTPSIGFVFVLLFLATVALFCLVLSAQRLLNRVQTEISDGSVGDANYDLSRQGC